jgi:hypothetical protein
VTEGQRRQVDPKQTETGGSAAWQDGVGELGVGSQSRDLEEDTERQVRRVDVGECTDLAAVAGQQGKRYVEDEQEDEHRAHAEAYIATHEGATVPPAAV